MEKKTSTFSHHLIPRNQDGLSGRFRFDGCREEDRHPKLVVLGNGGTKPL